MNEKFKTITEEELNDLIQTKKILESEGDYGCHCLYHKGDLTVNDYWLDDDSFYSLIDNLEHDIGTIAIDGNLTVKGNLMVTDRLHCLVVTGTLVANSFATFETEVYVGGDFKVKEYEDHNELLKVNGENSGQKVNQY